MTIALGAALAATAAGEQPSITTAQVSLAGWLGERWVESFAESPALHYYFLRDNAGLEVPVAALSTLSAAERSSLVGQAVTISGERQPDESVVVRSVFRDQAIASQVGVTAVTGSFPYVNLMCRFSDSSSEPNPPSFYAPIVANTYPKLDHYFRTVSRGAADLAGSGTASNWAGMSRPRNYYITSETDSSGNRYGDLFQDCLSAADPIVNFDAFIGVNMFFNSSLGCCSVGGIASLLAEGRRRSLRVTAMNPAHTNQLAVLAHEIGHTFGLPHSSGAYGATYDSRWDVMSSPGGRCAESDSTFGCVPQYTIAFHRDIVSWIPASRRWTATSGTRATITLADATGQDPGGYLMAAVPISGSSIYYTLEARRQAFPYDVNVPGDAVVIHRVDPSILGGGNLNLASATVIDPDGNGNPNDAGAMWTAGETFRDEGNGLAVTVVSTSATTATVEVTTYREFTDEILTVGVTAVRPVHITELRTRIGALRTRAGLATFAWTDPSLAAGTPIRAQHIVDLRLALTAVYSARSLSPPAYDDPGVAAGFMVRRVHISQLRAAVISIE